MSELKEKEIKTEEHKVNDNGKTVAPPMDPSVQPPKKKIKLSTDDETFFNNPKLSDCIITITQESTEPTEIHVSKLLLAKKSTHFREMLTSDPPITTLHLESQYKKEHLIDILRWMYDDSFQTTGTELLDVMALAQMYHVKAAAEHCAKELAENLTCETACGYLEHETKMRNQNPELKSDSEFGGFVTIWEKAKSFLKDKYKNFTYELWSSKEFLSLSVEGVKAIFSSDDLMVGTENTIFAAYRAWVRENFNERKKVAAQILPYIRFPLLQHNYLLDVVRLEGEMDYPEDAKRCFAKQIIDAYVFNCCSTERKDLLREVVVKNRILATDQTSIKYTWKISEISTKKDVMSDVFFLGGYYINLLFQRKNPTAKGGGTVGIYMLLKTKETGFGNLFYVPLVFEIMVRNKTTKKYTSTKVIIVHSFVHSSTMITSLNFIHRTRA
eukprot:TRINITY_DN4479_c0_g1_i2.p1 TRINITY_DN4479_c0_g1~~TRINITY_DN4479_c0_g1_i2.p1  ORF type:complete len:441 (+),score=105.33 TRINITY_DN4479_c0_g1_i2:139-1461(+)